MQKMPGHSTDIRKWQIRAFAGTWIAYAAFYFGRKTFAVAQPEIMRQFAITPAWIGIILTGHAIGYAVGQVLNGTLTDRIGPWKMLFTGFVLTILLNCFIGLTPHFYLIAIFWILNGYAQSFGWPAAIKGIATWFPNQKRGKLMAFWGPNYAVGEVAATSFAAVVLAQSYSQQLKNPAGEIVTVGNWSNIFLLSSLVLAILAILALMLFRDNPEHADINNPQSDSTPATQIGFWQHFKETVQHRHVLLLGGVHFTIKFIRTTFLFWAVTYLTFDRGFSTSEAGYISAIFPLAGILGAVIGSYLTDKFFGSRRAPVTMFMLIGLAGALFLFARVSNTWLPLAIGLVGFCNLGPDFIIAALAAMDTGNSRNSGTVAGIINGIGGMGQVFSGIMVGLLSHFWGWNIVLTLL
ncbi:MFS transporter, partial [bacterium]|nr:MFS transporter [bacterium]